MPKIPQISEFMDKTFVTLSPDMDVYKAIDVLLDRGVTSAVVVDPYDRIVGILSEKDCLTVLTKGVYHVLPSAKVSDIMTTKVVTTSADTDVFQVADIFLKHFFRRLVIADEDNKMIGQITRRDLLRVIRQWKKESKDTKKAPIM
ncbi:MAG: CBS domain-containing protein [Calditrichaeota bacterium]|nr:MAG: CBS domain-containing protein [Calditrichota bacterium]MBL1204580.1 CBS domain-containing protein [Calditrichota bacterium]NOG44409.1 CBS domain-containing protein [Calditrichota bacterium]